METISSAHLRSLGALQKLVQAIDGDPKGRLGVLPEALSEARSVLEEFQAGRRQDLEDALMQSALEHGVAGPTLRGSQAAEEARS